MILLLLLLASVAAAEPAARGLPELPAPIFVDRAADVGLDFHHVNGATGKLYFAEIMGPGGALFDFDDDGDLDVFLPQGHVLEPGKTPAQALRPPRHDAPLRDRLYRNDLEVEADGRRVLRFTDVTATSGIAPGGYAMGVAAGDFDNDGRVDLYVLNFGPNRLLRNLGGGRFEDVTERAGAGDARWSVGASFFDLDRDGWLDLYLVNYADFAVGRNRFCFGPGGGRDYCGPTAYPPVQDRLLRNEGRGAGGVVRFADVSRAAGILGAPATGLGVVATDFDGDGWQDLYVANDQMANFLYLNQRDGTFRDDALLAGCAVSEEGVPQSSMGVLAGDLDGDGDEDLFMTHLDDETNTVYLNDGRGLFADRSLASGLGTPSWRYTGFGTALVDVDSDGRLDLVVANGAVTFAAGGGKTLAQTDQLFYNAGAGPNGAIRFVEITDRAGDAFQKPRVGRGLAVGDVDNDGDGDVLVVNNDGPASLLLNRLDPGDDWLGLRLVGGDPPRDRLGTRVVLHRPGRPPLWRRVHTDGSYASAGDPRVLFGLRGVATDGLWLEVHWPDGRRERFDRLVPGRYATLVQGQGRPLVPPASP